MKTQTRPQRLKITYCQKANCVQKTQILYFTQNDLRVLFGMQKPLCRHQTNVAREKKTVIPDFLKKGIVQSEKRDKPLYSIYNIADYTDINFSFNECLKMHKEAAQPAMTNTLDALIYADIQLDFTTAKKTKFMKNIHGLIEFPHTFEHRQDKTIFVFTESTEERDTCKNLGAKYVGGDELIGMFNQGMFRKDEIAKSDFIFSSPSMAMKLLKLRPLLMDKLPTVKSGRVTNDLVEILKKHLAGVTYKSRKQTDATGKSQIPFGLLNQDDEILRENFEHLVATLLALKPKTQVPIIKSVQLIAPPSTEIFDMELKEFVKTADDKDVDDDDDDEN
ncbi:mitochondrial 54S ribosomal protein mrpl1 [Mactra antiquata]